jgi:hypothetical protein
MALGCRNDGLRAAVAANGSLLAAGAQTSGGVRHTPIPHLINVELP